MMAIALGGVFHRHLVAFVDVQETLAVLGLMALQALRVVNILGDRPPVLGMTNLTDPVSCYITICVAV